MSSERGAMKECYRCKAVLPRSEFDRHSCGKWRSECRPCHALKMRDWKRRPRPAVTTDEDQMWQAFLSRPLAA